MTQSTRKITLRMAKIRRLGPETRSKSVLLLVSSGVARGGGKGGGRPGRRVERGAKIVGKKFIL